MKNEVQLIILLQLFCIYAAATIQRMTINVLKNKGSLWRLNWMERWKKIVMHIFMNFIRDSFYRKSICTSIHTLIIIRALKRRIERKILKSDSQWYLVSSHALLVNVLWNLVVAADRRSINLFSKEKRATSFDLKQLFQRVAQKYVERKFFLFFWLASFSYKYIPLRLPSYPHLYIYFFFYISIIISGRTR